MICDESFYVLNQTVGGKRETQKEITILRLFKSKDQIRAYQRRMNEPFPHAVGVVGKIPRAHKSALIRTSIKIAISALFKHKRAFKELGLL